MKFARALIPILILTTSVAYAQVPRRGGPRHSPSKLRLEVDGKETIRAKQGEVFTVRINVDVDADSHIYPAVVEGEFGQPTLFEFGDLPVRVVEIRSPEPTRHESDGDVSWILTGRIPFQVDLVLTEGAAVGPMTLKGKGSFFLCDPMSCVYVDKPFEVPFEVLPGGTPVPIQAESESPFEGGLIALMLAAIGGGLITLVMPCVFPLIPMVLSYFARQGQERESHGGLLATGYAGGIVISFTAIGFLMSILLGPAGAREFAAHPWVNIGVAGLFLVFALSMFGLFKLQLPASWTNKLASKQRKGLVGAFVLGCLFSVVTFTCTVPIAGNVLVLAALGHPIWAAVGMLVYSGTMAVPFLLLGFFPGLLRRMPRGGGWMVTVERTIGVVEIALVAYYLSKADQVWGVGLLNREVMIGVWILVSLVAAGYLVFSLIRSRPFGAGRLVTHAAFVLLFLGLIVPLAPGFTGAPAGFFDAVLPPRPPEHHQTLEEALAEAREAKKPIFLEFTGIT